MEVTVESVGTTAGTSGLSREGALQQPGVGPVEPLPRSPPATAQPAAGPGGVRTSYQPRVQRRSRGPRRASHRDALVERLADDSRLAEHNVKRRAFSTNALGSIKIKTALFIFITAQAQHLISL
ncbi:uncharacterized protein [Dermacentor albipictus]